MFRRLPSGLPPEPKFPSDLKGLGYFVDGDSDEIRLIKNPRAYFNYFLTRNDRWNDVQREMMNGAIREIVLDRLHALGLEDLRLPLGAKQEDPHIPILVSKDLSTARHVVLFVGDHSQDLGIMAYRIVGGAGGINAGSVANMVKDIQSKMPGTAIIIGNLGQLRWWRRGGKAVTVPSWYANPRKSAVHDAPRFDEIKNTVEGNRTTAEHVDYLINSVIGQLCEPKAMVDIISVSDGSLQVCYFLDAEKNWERWGKRLGGLAMVAPYHRVQDLKNQELVDWLAKRARAYVLSKAPAGIPIRGCNGTKTTPGFGATCYSLGEPFIIERILPKGFATVVDWLKVVGEDEQYENEEVCVIETDELDVPETWDAVQGGDGNWLGAKSDIDDPATKSKENESMTSNEKEGPNIVVEDVAVSAEA